MEAESLFDSFFAGEIGSDDLVSEINRLLLHGTPKDRTMLTTRFESVSEKLSEDDRKKINSAITRYTYPASSGISQDNKTFSSIGINSIIKNRFVLLKELGVGGVGRVFMALDLRRKEAQDREPHVALKMLNSDFPDALKLLQREARKAQSLAHPNIARTYDFDRDGEIMYITMEFLEGETLATLLSRHDSGLAYDLVAPILRQVCSALDFAHSEGIIHCDLKPSNIFLLSDGRVKVIDFGIARVAPIKGRLDPDLTTFDMRGLGAMTPAYASVEMIQRAEPDLRDDVFAVACIIYELLEGRHPFGRLPADIAMDSGIVPATPKSLNRRQWQGLKAGLEYERQGRTRTAGQLYRDVFYDFEHRTSHSVPWFRSPWAFGIPAAALSLFLIFSLYEWGENLDFAGFFVRPSVNFAQRTTDSTSGGKDGIDDKARQALAAELKAAEDASRQEAARKASEDAARQEAARKEAERKAAEEAARQEAERKAAEEAARQVAAQKAAEETARQEAARKAAEDAARQEVARKAAEEAARQEAARKAAEEAAQQAAARKAAEEAAKQAAARKAAEEAAQQAAARKAADEAAQQAAARKAAEDAARQEAARKAAEVAAQQAAARKAAEEAAQQAAARKAADEAAQQAAARKAAEDAARQEAARKAADEAARQEAARRSAEMAAQQAAAQKAAEAAARKAAEEAVQQAAARKAAEDAARQEAARKAAEDAARQAAAQKAAEEAARQAAAQKAAEEAAQQAAARKAAEDATRQEAARKAAEDAARQETARKAAEVAAQQAAARKAADEAAQQQAAAKANEDAARTSGQDGTNPPSGQTSTVPDELAWSDAERRSVQSSLGVLGHFRGAISGNFGADTWSAIRGWQAFEGTSVTGHLSGEQRDQILHEAELQASLLRMPGQSPRGTAATAIRGGRARFLRGTAFERGDGQPKDFAEAAYWYALAAADGWPAAYTNLGILYARGQGVAQTDIQAAQTLWRRAAALGEGTAMYNLGAIQENGIGVPVDLKLARRWYARAAERNHAASALALKRLGG